jgi:cellulose biosynthesis protein BcsQ
MDEDELESLWESPSNRADTVFRAVKPLQGVGDLHEPTLRKITQGLYLIPGDVALAGFEDTLAEAWPNSMADANLFRPFRILTSFWHVAQMAASKVDADLILVDVGPNLGAINRAVLIATDHVVIPLGADLFSLQGLKNLGPTLRTWRSLWTKRLDNWQTPDFELPRGMMSPAGYIVQQHSVRLSRPVIAYDKWVNRIPRVYRESILNEEWHGELINDDPYCLATVKHYRSLMPMAQEKRKPIFKLTSSDGAIGAHARSVQDAYADFETLANRILSSVELANI